MDINCADFAQNRSKLYISLLSESLGLSWSVSNVKHSIFWSKKDTIYLFVSPLIVFEHSRSQNSQKLFSNNMKNNINWTFGLLDSFGVIVKHVFHHKTAFTSSKSLISIILRPFFKNSFLSSKECLGPRILSLLKVFNILSYQIYRKFEKKCIKTLKIGNICRFCHVWCQFWVILVFLGSTKKVQKSLLIHDTNFTSVEFYGWSSLSWI